MGMRVKSLGTFAHSEGKVLQWWSDGDEEDDDLKHRSHAFEEQHARVSQELSELANSQREDLTRLAKPVASRWK
jgi:DNA-binding transcriptional MerR regulator